MSFNFQSNNPIHLINENPMDSSKTYRFTDSYTISILKVSPKGVNADEFYVDIGKDETLINFLNEIPPSVGITDFSIEKTLVGLNMITLKHTTNTKFELVTDHGICKINCDLLGSEYSKIKDNLVNLTVIASKFTIQSNKHLIMDFTLTKLSTTCDEYEFGMESSPRFFVSPQLKLNDYLKQRPEPLTIDHDKTKLFDLYDQYTSLTLIIED